YGLSLAHSDLLPHASKAKHIEEAKKSVHKTERVYDRGIWTRAEANHQIYDAWANMAEQLDHDSGKRFADDPFHALALCARAPSVYQTHLRQISQMIGTIWDDSRRFPREPVTHCYAEGLTSQEYFRVARVRRNSQLYEATTRRDAEALTERIANALENIVVTERDCGSCFGVVKHAPGSEDRRARKLSKLLAGRVSREKVVDPLDGRVVVEPGQLITREIAQEIESLRIARLEVRSPVYCDSASGVCQMCYGADPRTGELAALGTAVGTLATLAVSQMLPRLRPSAVRTGIANHSQSDVGEIRSKRHGVVSLANLELAITPNNQRVALAEGFIEILDHRGRVADRYDVPQGAEILKAAGASVHNDELLAKWNPSCVSVYSRQRGTVAHDALIPGRNMKLDPDGEVGVLRVHAQQFGKHPCVLVKDAFDRTVDFCFLPKNSLVYALPGQSVDRGSLLAKIPTSREGVADWHAGGVSHLEKILMAEEPTFKAVLAEVDGVVEQTTLTIDRTCTIWIHPVDSDGNVIDGPVAHEIDMNHTGHLLVRSKDRVHAGDRLTSGEKSPQDVLRILGLVACAEMILDQVEKCVRVAQFELDERHIEMLLLPMLSYTRVEVPGDSGLEAGNFLLRATLRALNDRMRSFLKVDERGDSFLPSDGLVSQKQFDAEIERLEHIGGQMPICSQPWPAGGRPVLLGIDEAATRTTQFNPSARTSSFLSSDGYAMTQSAIVRAALTGHWHNLSTVKDSIITGELMPVGSGWPAPEEA
ncbi:MAG: hypothetical protein MI757_02290, partial [Pirellulales bacterium]|nr:hypothetical protein [Pirellulales bacterium]